MSRRRALESNGWNMKPTHDFCSFRHGFRKHAGRVVSGLVARKEGVHICLALRTRKRCNESTRTGPPVSLTALRAPKGYFRVDPKWEMWSGPSDPLRPRRWVLSSAVQTWLHFVLSCPDRLLRMGDGDDDGDA